LTIPPFFSALGLGGKQTLLLTGCSRGFKQQKLLEKLHCYIFTITEQRFCGIWFFEKKKKKKIPESK
jgi:hypothetical protein